MTHDLPSPSASPLRGGSHRADTGGHCVEAVRFRTNSYGDPYADGVEAAGPPRGAAVRDSRHPGAGRLPFSAAVWDAFPALARSRPA